jgi:hypothetical protein
VRTKAVQSGLSSDRARRPCSFHLCWVQHLGTLNGLSRPPRLSACRGVFSHQHCINPRRPPDRLLSQACCFSPQSANKESRAARASRQRGSPNLATRGEDGVRVVYKMRGLGGAVRSTNSPPWPSPSPRPRSSSFPRSRPLHLPRWTTSRSLRLRRRARSRWTLRSSPSRSNRTDGRVGPR